MRCDLGSVSLAWLELLRDPASLIDFRFADSDPCKNAQRQSKKLQDGKSIIFVACFLCDFLIFHGIVLQFRSNWIVYFTDITVCTIATREVEDGPVPI